MVFKSSQFVKKVLDALKGHIGSGKSNTLAKTLGVSSNTLNNWQSRNSLNFHNVIGYCLDEKIDLNKLFMEGRVELLEEQTPFTEILDKLGTITAGNEEVLLAITKISTELKLQKAKDLAAKVTSGKSKT